MPGNWDTQQTSSSMTPVSWAVSSTSSWAEYSSFICSWNEVLAWALSGLLTANASTATQKQTYVLSSSTCCPHHSQDVPDLEPAYTKASSHLSPSPPSCPCHFPQPSTYHHLVFLCISAGLARNVGAIPERLEGVGVKCVGLGVDELPAALSHFLSDSMYSLDASYLCTVSLWEAT